MLHKLLSGFNNNGFKSSVVSLTDIGRIGDRILELGIEVEELDMKRGIPNPIGLARLVRIIRDRKPDVIQSWMYHADLIAGLSARASGNPPVVWNIRNTNLHPASKKLTLLSVRLGAWLSNSLPAKIVCCSESARREHIKLGYSAGKMLVIPNGFDTDSYRPNERNKIQIRDEIKVDPGILIIGLVARYDPQKDFSNFLKAAKQLLEMRQRVMFVMVGEGVDRENVELTNMIRESGLEADVRLLGSRDDMPKVTCVFDIATSSSRCNEGFSNTVGEAMSCGVPCVVTDVGDSKDIVGETGLVVPPADSTKLAYSWKQLIDEGKNGRSARGEQARQRIVNRFGLEMIRDQYRAIYQDVINHVRT